CGIDGIEDAATREDLLLEVAEQVIHGLLDLCQPFACLEAGVGRGSIVALTRRRNGGELQLLFGPEMRIDAALATPQPLRQAANGEVVEAIERRYVCGPIQDPLAGHVAFPEDPA